MQDEKKAYNLKNSSSRENKECGAGIIIKKRTEKTSESLAKIKEGISI